MHHEICLLARTCVRHSANRLQAVCRVPAIREWGTLVGIFLHAGPLIFFMVWMAAGSHSVTAYNAGRSSLQSRVFLKGALSDYARNANTSVSAPAPVGLMWKGVVSPH